MDLARATPSGRNLGTAPIFGVTNRSRLDGKSGEVQPKQGTPARVLLLWPFQSSELHGATVCGPRQPRLKNMQPRPPSTLSSMSYSWYSLRVQPWWTRVEKKAVGRLK